MNIHFVSSPLAIGKHEWRVLVKDCRIYGPNPGDAPCLVYQWRCLHLQRLGVCAGC